MKQTRRASMIEALLNVAIGFGVALATQLILFPIFGIHVRFLDDVLIGICFTAISIVRSYAVRRLFEALRVNEVLV